MNSVNVTRLNRFWQAVESRTTPVTVVAFGDSLQTDYRSLEVFLFPRLQASLGRAGTAILFPWGWQVERGGAAVYLSPGTNWWHTQNALGPGGYLMWSHGETLGVTVTADRAGVFYLATPTGGDFVVSTATNGGGWTSNLTVNTYSPVTEGRYTNLVLTPASYRLRVDSLSGTNIILGSELFLSTSRGIKPVYLQKDGMALGDFLSVPDAILTPVISNLAPDLIIYHMKELGDVSTQSILNLSNQLEQLDMFWKTCVPGADVIYIGTPYEDRDANGTPVTIAQNLLARGVAVRNNRGYVDGMTDMVSYDYMLSNGYMDDGIHPSNKYYQWLADTVWNQALFSLLRQDRSLQIRLIAEGGFELSCPRFTNTSHQLLGSTNLIDWEVLEVVGPGTQLWSVTNPPAQFFRWQFRPL